MPLIASVTGLNALLIASAMPLHADIAVSLIASQASDSSFCTIVIAAPRMTFMSSHTRLKVALIVSQAPDQSPWISWSATVSTPLITVSAMSITDLIIVHAAVRMAMISVLWSRRNAAIAVKVGTIVALISLTA